jgi:hypothetical protein
MYAVEEYHIDLQLQEVLLQMPVVQSYLTRTAVTPLPHGHELARQPFQRESP